MSILAATALALAQTAAATPRPELRAVRATSSKTPALNRISDMVEVGTIPSRGANDLHYALRRTVTGLGRTDVTWNTTHVCPSAREAIGAMEQLSASPDVPGFGAENDRIILVGVSYVLAEPNQIPGGGSRFLTTSNVETSLARWMEMTLKVLQPCWRNTL